MGSKEKRFFGGGNGRGGGGVGFIASEKFMKVCLLAVSKYLVNKK